MTWSKEQRRQAYVNDPERFKAATKASHQRRLQRDPAYQEVLNERARQYRAANRELIAARRSRVGGSVDRGQLTSGLAGCNSVFALGRSYTDQVSEPVTPAGRSYTQPAVTPVQGAGAQRREGDEVHLLTDSEFKATTWRAPWAPGYALSGSGNT